MSFPIESYKEKLLAADGDSMEGIWSTETSFLASVEDNVVIEKIFVHPIKGSEEYSHPESKNASFVQLSISKIPIFVLVDLIM